MTSFRKTLRKSATGGHFARPLLASALALGLLTAGTGAALAKDAQPSYSDKFRAAAGPLQTALAKQQGKPADPAIIAALKQQLDAATAAASTADDKYLAGRFAINVGSLAQDTALQAKGVHEMLDSGKSPPAEAAKFHAALAQWAYQAKDYATAEAELKLAIAGGDSSVDVLTTLAETQFALGQTADGLTTLQQAMAAQKAAGQVVPDGWYIRGIQVADTAKLRGPAADLAAQLAGAYPTPQHWALAIDRRRFAGQYPAREMLDLLRLMGRTNSYQNAADYLEYVADADPRRLPGEAKQVLDAGVAAGKLSPTNTDVREYYGVINGRIATDKASMPAAYAHGKAAATSAALVIGDADALLNYGDYAKASELYQAALAKPGVDANLALTRLGIAQFGSGDYAGAQASFAKVSGPRADIAKLWALYTQQKAAGK